MTGTSSAFFDQIARTSQDDLDFEATISKMVELYAPEIETDTSEAPLDLSRAAVSSHRR